MSFLAGRSAAKEGAYFFNESKLAITRLADKSISNPSTTAAAAAAAADASDILPEVLRHSLPPKILRNQDAAASSSSSSLSASSRWTVKTDGRRRSDDGVAAAVVVSPDALNPLRGFVSLPQVTFGPRRWQLPQAGGWVTASTANELRRDEYAHVYPQKLKDAAAGIAQIGKAFAAATAIIFGGAAVTFGLAASKLEIHSSNDIRTKGREIVQPKFEAFRERLNPLRSWAEDMSKKWHVEVDRDLKEKPVIKELSKNLRAKS